MEYYLPNNYTENKTVVVSDWNYQNENVTYDTLQTKFDALIGGAPELLEDLNSLRELADGINNDPLFYSKVVTTSTTQTISGTKTFSDPVIFNGNVNIGNSNNDLLTVNRGATLINLKTNGNIDTNQIVMALKNTDVQQGMAGALKEAIYSNGLMAPTSNKTQLMNRNINESSLT